MGLKFGTSGVRGLVTDMTDYECFVYSSAYVEYLKKSGSDTVCIAGDFRSSTPRIMNAVGFAVKQAGLNLLNLGFVPTPLLAHYARSRSYGAVMVTGSHIPDDRNGIKFYMPEGEILKTDEQAVSALYADLKKENPPSFFNEAGELLEDIDIGKPLDDAVDFYIKRYVDVFAEDSLKGVRVVFYQHSTVGREIIPVILEKLGCEVIKVGWSDSFVPVDTEAVENEQQLAEWVKVHQCDALVSADGDCDRPLLVDEKGVVIRGDVLGIITSCFLEADFVSTPVSCNTALELCGQFKDIERTKIGSPYVIESMTNALSAGFSRIVGYEANGGFLTASDFTFKNSRAALAALPTRDAVLPLLSALILSQNRGKGLSLLKNELPPRYTVSGIIREFPTETGKKIVTVLMERGLEFINNIFGQTFGKCIDLNTTDGCRMTFEDGGILHFRPSGNAPEFRIYTEYSTQEQAQRQNEKGRDFVLEVLKPMFK